jgi:hypothetical protein
MACRRVGQKLRNQECAGASLLGWYNFRRHVAGWGCGVSGETHSADLTLAEGARD